MENKAYVAQFRTDTNTGRKRISALKSKLSNAGVFCYETDGNTTSHRAVYVDTDNIGKASKIWGGILAEENKRFAPK